MITSRHLDEIPPGHRGTDIDITNAIGSINNRACCGSRSIGGNFEFDLPLTRWHSVAVCVVTNDTVATGRADFKVQSGVADQLAPRNDGLAGFTYAFNDEFLT